VPSLFWQHEKEILNVASAQECESKVQALVARSKIQVNDDGVTFAFIQPTNLAVANGLPKNGLFDTIIDCSMQGQVNRSHYLHLPIPEGKKGQNILTSSIPKAIQFVRVPLIENKRILIFCDTGKKKLQSMLLGKSLLYNTKISFFPGKDNSIGILLAILVKYFNTKGELTLESSTRGKL
jgi:tRNA A64-2'-O-ribosylphosphate transferase